MIFVAIAGWCFAIFAGALWLSERICARDLRKACDRAVAGWEASNKAWSARLTQRGDALAKRVNIARDAQ